MDIRSLRSMVFVVDISSQLSQEPQYLTWEKDSLGYHSPFIFVPWYTVRLPIIIAMYHSKLLRMVWFDMYGSSRDSRYTWCFNARSSRVLNPYQDLFVHDISPA